MQERWASSGLDLHLELAGSGVGSGLEAALRDAVRTGRLAPGLRLPSSRALATDLRVSRNTVAAAYSRLVAEGWLTARQGSGTAVADLAPDPARTPPAPPQHRPPRYDLRPGSPNVSAFPRTAWLAAARRALSAAPATALGYTDPRGLPELRGALAGYLARTRGVRTAPDRIVVSSGFSQALGLVCDALACNGVTMLAVEGFGLADHRRIVESRGMSLTALPVDRFGAAVEQIGQAGAVLLTPAHQFPLGVALGPERRRRVVAWAASTGGTVLEDDYDGEFRYDREPVGAVQALAPERVVYAGTASKSLAPGVRLGWLALPARLVDDVVEAKRLSDRNSSAFDQLTLAELIASGQYDRQVRRARLSYRRRRDQLITSLQPLAPFVRVTGIAAGLHALVELHDDVQEADVVTAAQRRGLALDPLAAYSTAPETHGPALVVGYATPPDHAYTAALARLSTALAETAGRRRPGR